MLGGWERAQPHGGSRMSPASLSRGSRSQDPGLLWYQGWEESAQPALRCLPADFLCSGKLGPTIPFPVPHFPPVPRDGLGTLSVVPRGSLKDVHSKPRRDFPPGTREGPRCFLT